MNHHCHTPGSPRVKLSEFALILLILALATSVDGEGEEKTWNVCSVEGGSSASDFATELSRPGIESMVDVEVDSVDYDDTRCETAYNPEGEPMAGKDLGKLVIEKQWDWGQYDSNDDLDGSEIEDTYCKLLCERKEGCVAWEFHWASVRGTGGASCYGYSELYYEPELRNVGNCGSSRTASSAGLCTPLPNDTTIPSVAVASQADKDYADAPDDVAEEINMELIKNPIPALPTLLPNGAIIPSVADPISWEPVAAPSSSIVAAFGGSVLAVATGLLLV